VTLDPAACAAIAGAVPALLIAILFERVRRMKRPFLIPESRAERLTLSALRSAGVLAVAVMSGILEIAAVLSAGSGLEGGWGVTVLVLFGFLFAFVALRWAFTSRGFEDLSSLVRESRWYRSLGQRALNSSKTPDIIKRSLRNDLTTSSSSHEPA
jgi:hypothetical protein